MIGEATSIQLSGANFSTPTQLPVFRAQGNKPGKFVKASLLYGRNGTGKSTIARAFRKLGGEDVPVIMSAELLDDDEVPITLSSDDQRRIFVFDEDFVEEKVKLREEDLETIVMLGEAGDIEERLKEATEARGAAKKAVERLEDTMEGYSDAKSPKSPAYYRSRLTSVLKGDDAWAGRDKEIREGRQNTSVKSDTYKGFVGLKPSKPKDRLLVEFREGMERLRAARTGSARIDERVPRLPTISEASDEETTSLLREVIQSPELSDRELFLLELVEKGQGDKVSAIAKDFGCAEVTRCPHCLQEVTEEYKRGLVQSVSKVLSKTVEEHKESLRQCLIGTVEQDRLDLSAFRDLEGYNTCDTLLKALNTAIREHDDLINKKIDNPYEPVIEAPQPIGPLVTQVRTSLASLEDERVAFNTKVTDVSSIEEELRGINADIAHYDVRDLAAQLKVQESEQESAQRQLEEARADLSDKEKAVEALEAEKRSVKIAAESINSCMSYIFFSKNRLQIVLENGEYRLRSHGRNVRPREVSVGERNILALSYFFTSILEGKRVDAYDDECLIVLDDPVSSYDLENKVGILSFLSFELGRFLGSNKRTRALIMTHDLGTMFDLEATLSDMKDSINTQGSSVGIAYELLELADGQIGRFLFRKRHEYTELVGAVYDYACDKPSPHELVIGNMMRQMLEAYARFVHGCGIEAVSTSEEILATLPGEEYRSYFRNLMYRLVLHGGSHRDKQVRAMSDMRFFESISKAEKRRTARDVLCLIYLLSKNHLCAHLHVADSNAGKRLEEWCSDIRKRAVALP